ncbi:hypothetical protein EDD76_1204 [Kineothrix alysoides]|uniref:Uncharacterized protein n=1 Tax=Kineothrix alysoides TaxID=1469948 RepID=A0A4R1QL42_9FIRM|nr:hypothetical protein EDD76_1204 [Kineothrix alysoides]
MFFIVLYVVVKNKNKRSIMGFGKRVFDLFIEGVTNDKRRQRDL